ncbi:MAG TPA: sulfatase [bacterium]|nr:sulfatase [bacterium]
MNQRTIRRRAGLHNSLLIFFLAAALLPAALGCSSPPVKHNIVLILVDTLRADHLGCYGYQRPITPNIDKLAKESTLFEQAFSHSPWTMPSVASIMTSLPPRDHGITNWKQPLAERHLTLAEQLRKDGYATAAVVSHFIFEPKYNFNQGFDFFDYSVLEKGHPKKIHSSGEVSDIAIKQLDELGESNKPFFLWLHYFDPHNDYLKHEGYDYGNEPVDLYDSEIAFTDHHIGRVLQKLDNLGLHDKTIVVFMADHGEEFRDHGGTRHSRTLYNEVLRIPLMIRAPGFSPQRIKTTVKESDLAPTLLTLIGQQTPKAFSGKTFTIKGNKIKVDTPRTVFAETFRMARKKGVVHQNWKLIHDLKKKRFQLFNLETDPIEKVNLFKSNQQMAGKLKQMLRDHYKVKRAKVEEKPLDSDLEEKLRSLGYIN